MKKTLLLFFLLHIIPSSAQEYFPKNDGVKSQNSNYTAFTNGHIHVSPDQSFENATLLIHKGKVVNVGRNISLPENTIIIDIKDKSIYPSFIDTYSNFGLAPAKSKNGRTRGAQYDSKRKGYYWNEHIMPEKQALSQFTYDQNKAKELLKAGFGAVNTHDHDGIVRGNGLLINLNSEGNNSERIIDVKSVQYLSFEKSKIHKQVYPNSLMGSIALLKQMYYDAEWYEQGNAKTTDLSLEALNDNKNLVQIFYAGDKNNALRAKGIADSFGLNYVLVGGGDEYERISDIKNSNATYILPLNFPVAYDVEDPYQANYVSLKDMRRWNQAPSNPAILAKNGVNYAFTTYNSKTLSDFKTNILKAIEYGLDKKIALAALTTVPASILNKSDILGTLNKGAYANFLITSGDVFDKKTILYENWVQGNNHIINDINAKDITGNYDLKIGSDVFSMEITSYLKKPKLTIKKGATKISSKFIYKDNWFNLSLKPDSISNQYFRLSGKVQNATSFGGKVTLTDGTESDWKAIRTKNKENKSRTKDKTSPFLTPISYPNGSFGFSQLPTQESILFRDVTVWTNEEQGILEHTDVLIKDGVIAKIGKDLKAGRARVIVGSGKHLTSGIIDEHSHIATISTNESGHNSTAEVSMEDAINYEDINIYRNLAGGVTQAQILHGSANPIGGQSAIIKLKWGETSDKMIDKNAPKFIKFALGENVKQSNWNSTNRFPQTRMGVEQVYNDYFQRAKEYDQLKKSGKSYRRDIEMEVLAEIINKERFISCHSYVQSEINMLMKIAKNFDFTVNTFTHILEGYKVADKMKAHGAGGSTFSDWWAYKYEVNDAIPYNAAIMHSQGVVTAINSDDAEMSRRLNQEAAKTIKYGGVSEEDAWKFVTLNPAKLLHIDDKVGSIKVGKDADLVLWSSHPLSVNAKAEKTLIEGVVYFDLDRDSQLRTSIKKEKNILINQMLESKNKGQATQKPRKKTNRINHCDTVDL